MAIQWFPGHMNVTRKAIAERVKDIDVVLELLDARLPGSSANPMLAELTAGRPTLKILNKQDLADPTCTTAWLDHYNAQSGTRALALDASQTTHRQAIIDACHTLSPLRGGMAKPMRVLACGVPNVGKSTLINTLSAKRQAKTGDEAGITKLEQRIVLADDFYLWDTPGMLWPRITVPRAGYNLAISGAVGRNAYDDEEVALELVAYLKGRYAGLLAARFKVPNAGTLQDEELLEDIGRRRGALLGRGKVNLQKAAEIVIFEFRAATLGRITLETPEEFLAWTAEGEAAEALRQSRRDERKRTKTPRATPAAPDEEK